MSEGHAKLAPSAAHRWMQCPGSVALCAAAPDRDSVHAREGTFAHAIAANILLQDIDHATECIGETDGEFTVDADMAKHIQTYVSAVRTMHMLSIDGELQVEQRVILTPELWGTSDALIWSPGVLDVIDLKFGQGILVMPEDNEQEEIYGLAALNTFPEKVAEYGVKTVNLHINQPRRLDSDGEAHRTHPVTVEFLDNWWENEVRPVINEIDGGDPHFHPGDHCQFCDGKATCPELSKVALASANDVFTEVNPTKELIVPPVPKGITPKQLAFAIANAEIVELWLKAVRDSAFDRARAGEKIPGHKLVAKIGNRRWKDPALVEKILANHGLDPFEKKLLSPAKVEKAFGKGGKATVNPLTERPVTGHALVRDADKRPAIAGGEIFDVLPS